jgi:PAS domain S-box-containing protein
MTEPHARDPFEVDLRQIIDALPHAIVVTDPDGAIVLWNLEAERTYGYAEAEVLGRPVVETLSPHETMGDYHDRFDSVRAGEPAIGDSTIRRRDGALLRVSRTTQRIVDDDGTVTAIVGSAEDVTERRAAEQAARDLADHFRLALEAGGLGTWRWDLKSGRTTWDERLESLFGLEPGTFDGTFESYVTLLHPEDRDTVLARIDQAVQERTTYTVDHRVTWPDGSVHWLSGAGRAVVDESGEVIGTIGCCLDVTDRVEHELAQARLAAEAVETAANERVLRERLEFLSAIHDALVAAPDRRDVMVRVAQAAVPRLGDWCAIHVLPESDLLPATSPPDVEIAHVDPAMVELAQSLRERFPYDPHAATGVPHVIRTGEVEFYPEITPDLLDDVGLDDEARAIVEQLALRSSITVPLTKGRRTFGAMQFVMSSSRRRYTESDVALAIAIAGRIASNLENRRLNNVQRHIADTLQRSLVPASLPLIDELDMAVRYWAAGEGSTVGGDFYDVFELDAESWAVVIGDVCGTGPAAAAITGLARHTIRDSAWHGDDPLASLHSLNRAILRETSSTFCTAVVGQLRRTAAGIQLHVASGGHPLPILVTPTSARTVGRPGTLLGVFERTTFHDERVDLRPDDTIVLYTDGATDVTGNYGLTAEEFADLVAEEVRAARSVEAAADGIHRRLAAILPFDRRNDDIALLVLRAR